MAGIGLVGVSVAGGVITGPGSSKMTVGGIPVAMIGDSVAGHGNGAHAAPVMSSGGSSKFTVGGIPVCLDGSIASCGHAMSGGAGNFTVG